LAFRASSSAITLSVAASVIGSADGLVIVFRKPILLSICSHISHMSYRLFMEDNMEHADFVREVADCCSEKSPRDQNRPPRIST
jgi:hypothetical protein